MINPTISNNIRAMYESEDGLFILHLGHNDGHRSLGQRTAFVRLGWENIATKENIVVKFHDGIYLAQADTPHFVEELNAAFNAAAEFNTILEAK